MERCERRAGGGRLRAGHGPKPTFLFAAKGTVTYTNEISYPIPSGEHSLISDLPEGFALHKQKGQLSSADTLMASQTKNLFLSSLSPASREWLVSRCTAVALPQKMRLYKPDRRPAYAYFVTSGIASVVSEMSDGASAEVGMIGREGIVGALHILGPVAAPTHCFVQMEGTALRMPLAELVTIFQESAEVRDAVLKLVQKDAMVLSQIAGCHRLHSAEERLSRWLLMAQDQTQTDDLHFTQALLANMLGARRATVTEVAGSLQRKGLIQYHRAHVIITDRDGLERAACQCYQVIKELRGDLYHIS